MSEETEARFAADLAAAGHVVTTSNPGILARSGDFERVVAGIIGGMRAAIDPGEQVTYLQFPPVMVQDDYVKTDYVASFPNLMGIIDIFAGGNAEHRALLAQLGAGEDWTADLTTSGLAMVSAACHPLHASLAGQSLSEPRRFDLGGWCFRHEPSPQPGRMVSFRMHEQVYVGTPEGAVAHRDAWLEKLLDLLIRLGLDAKAEIANDPFFGRVGKMLSNNQREENLKFELVAEIAGRPTALCSGNAHQAHFGENFVTTGPHGGPSHSSCAGIGLERVALALLWKHGLDVGSWPAEVRDVLGLS